MYHRDLIGTLAVTSSTGESLTLPHTEIHTTRRSVIHRADEGGPVFPAETEGQQSWGNLKTAGLWVGRFYDQGKICPQTGGFMQDRAIRTEIKGLFKAWWDFSTTKIK